MNILCKYSCNVCGLRRVPISVPVRQAEEDVADWMNGVVRQVGEDHQRKSGGCPATELTELMIPMSGTDYIGGPRVH